MHINKDGILMSCIYGCLLNLYEIKGKNYKKIERIRPYSILDILIGRFSDRDSINELIELKNGNLVIMVYSYAICFYKKKEKSYSYLNKINQNIDESATDLCEIGNKEYCFCFGFKNIIKFFETNSQKITHTIKLYDFSSSLSNNQILLINKTDLIVAGEKSIIIIDVVKKEITYSMSSSPELHQARPMFSKKPFNALKSGHFFIRKKSKKKKKMKKLSCFC